MKDYYIFGSYGVPVKISQNPWLQLVIEDTIFDKERLIKQLEELIVYLKAYAK